MKAIVNANIVLQNGIIWDGVILANGSRISDFGTSRDISIPDDAQIIDADGAYVGPGFVDIHVHGGGGFSTTYHTADAAKFFLKHGTTSILATTDYHMSLEETIKAIRSIKQAMDSGCAPTVKGIYAEGPYTNPDYGSHSYLNPWRGGVEPGEYKLFVDEAASYVKVWTIDPDRDGIGGFCEYARKVNPDVIFALGHSEATPMQVQSLGRYKPSVLTHAMCGTFRKPVYGGTRGYGPDEYCFKEPDMYAELISDSCGIHVHAQMQQLLLHTKGRDKVILVTDSTVHNNPVPDNLKHVTDLNFDANGGIAGSKLTMDMACRNIMTHTSCGICGAFVMASLNPARLLGMEHEIGSIEKGKIADLVFVDDKFNVKDVMLGGQMCV